MYFETPMVWLPFSLLDPPPPACITYLYSCTSMYWYYLYPYLSIPSPILIHIWKIIYSSPPQYDW